MTQGREKTLEAVPGDPFWVIRPGGPAGLLARARHWLWRRRRKPGDLPPDASPSMVMQHMMGRIESIEESMREIVRACPPTIPPSLPGSIEALKDGVVAAQRSLEDFVRMNDHLIAGALYQVKEMAATRAEHSRNGDRVIAAIERAVGRAVVATKRPKAAAKERRVKR